MNFNKVKTFYSKKKKKIYEEDDKRSYGIEKMFANYIFNKGLISKIHKKFSKLNNKKTKQTIKVENEHNI